MNNVVLAFERVVMQRQTQHKKLKKSTFFFTERSCFRALLFRVDE
jgi:hypothetical protein